MCLLCSCVSLGCNRSSDSYAEQDARIEQVQTSPEVPVRVDDPRSAEAVAESFVAETVGYTPRIEDVRDMLGYARGGCVNPNIASQSDISRCVAARLYLSEQLVAEADDEYYHYIEQNGVTSMSDVRQEWHAVHAHLRHKWREYRNYECAISGFYSMGGSGASIQMMECLIEMNNERARSISER